MEKPLTSESHPPSSILHLPSSSSPSSPRWAASPAEPDEWPAALAVLYQHLPPDEQAQQVKELLLRVADGRMSLAGLQVARRGGEIGGCLLLLEQPDRTAFIWPPVSVANDPEVEAVLFAAARDWVDRAPILWAQCLVSAEQTALRETLTGNGFPLLVELQVMVRSWEIPLPAPPASSSLVSIPYSDELESRFAECLGRTYAGSRDCPQVSELRSAAEALRGYLLAGEPAGWRLYERDGEDVGVALLSFHPDQSLWELVYLGVVPEARGKTFGREMLVRGLHEIAPRPGLGVFLCVDAANCYAIELYQSLGFVGEGRQAVHWRMASGTCGS